MKEYITLLILKVLLIILLYPVGIKSQDAPNLKLAVISIGLPNDLGYNYQVNQGMIYTQKKYNSTQMNYFGNISEEECESAVKELIEVEQYSIIIALSPSHENCIRNLLEIYLDRYFMFLSSKALVSNNTRSVSVDISYEIISYICGYYAGLITKTNKIGYITPGPPLFNSYVANSFYVGATASNPNVTLEYYTIGSWLDPELSTGATTELISKGIDIIGQNLQDMSVSLTAVDSGKYGMGTNGFDQSKVFGKRIPFSYTLDWTVILPQIISPAISNSSVPFKAIRADVRNSFITIVMGDSINSTIKNQISNFMDQLKLTPLNRYHVLCNNYNPYLVSNVSPSILCISKAVLINITDPFPGMTPLGNYTIPISLSEMPSSITKVFTIISIVFLGLSVFLIVLIYLCRNKPTFRYASPTFSILITLGCMVVYGGVIVWVVPITLLTCNLRLWLVSEGFTILIGSIVVKNLRIWLIFDNPELRTIRITNLQLFPWIFFLVILNGFLMVIISYRGGVEVSNVFDVDDLSKYEYLQTCSMNKIGWISLYALLAYFGVLIVIGLFASWKTRIFDIARFNESKPIANTLYTITFGLTIIISLIVSPQTYQNQTIILAISGLFITTSSILILFIPKFLYINSSYTKECGKSVITTSRSEQQNSEDNSIF